METKLIELVLGLVCLAILYRGVIVPLGKVVVPGIHYLLRLLFPLLKQDELEKQKEALETAKKRVRIAELQKETVKTEKQAMKIQDSIIDEEFEELNEEKNFRTKA